MIRIYKQRDYLYKQTKYNVIEDVGKIFDIAFAKQEFDLDSKDVELMKIIDRAILTNPDGLMETPYGSNVQIDKLSTGCKTCILANHAGKNDVISINQCGDNAIQQLLYMDNRKYLLTFCNISSDLKLNYPVIVGKNKYDNAFDLQEEWAK